MKMPNPLRANIIAGIPTLIDSAIETATGKTEPFRSLTIARELSKRGTILDLDQLVERMWMQLESNWVRAGVNAEARATGAGS